MKSTVFWASYYGLRLDASDEFVQGYIDGMRLDQRGQGVACGRGWIPRSKKCSRDKASQTSKEAKARTAEKSRERAKLKGEAKISKNIDKLSKKQPSDLTPAELKLALRRVNKEKDNAQDSLREVTQMTKYGLMAKPGMEDEANKRERKLLRISRIANALNDENDRRNAGSDTEKAFNKAVARRKEKQQKRSTAAEIRKIRQAEESRRKALNSQPIEKAVDVIPDQGVRDQVRRRISYALKDGPISSNAAVESIQGVGRSQPYQKRIVRRLRRAGLITPEPDRNSLKEDLDKVMTGSIADRESSIRALASKHNISEDEAFAQYRQARDNNRAARRKARHN